jgi:signal transduction histidine kinase
MKWPIQVKLIIAGFSLSVLLLSVVSVIAYQNSQQLIKSDDKVKHTYKVLKTLTDVLTTLMDAESGRRGYLLFRDEEELERYHLAIQSIRPQIDLLRQMTATHSYQQQRLTELETLINQRIQLFQQSIELIQAGKQVTDVPALIILENKKNQADIRDLMTEIQQEEEQILERWVGQYESSMHATIVIEFLGTFLSFAILLGVYALLYQQISKRQQAEAIQRSLTHEKELSELKLRFFSMVSHEFRTPLSIILGSAQLLAESRQQWTEEKKIKNLKRIQSSAKLMTQLLTDLLTLTRAEVGKLECHPKLIDLESFCLNLIEDIQLGYPKNLNIQLLNQDSCTYANLDEKLLYSILGNLLSNALKFSSENGVINFLIKQEENALVFQIQDQGIGIAEAELSQIYEPLYRGSNVTHIGGTGLGLAVVKKCVELHGGDIQVQSRLGVGTTFVVKIPQNFPLSHS